ncbi:Zinc finger, C3HC4 type (RING finger) and transmembrane domain-containing protein [Spironucleus salmonicida]|uniref:Zinc finger, C3HC4 type (RING finger) and transmembrane domain-containing protein n=1 Tax=Spironucleus salmonicida TaxID=348837 RepID=V6LVG7_9EUKA|nr:Zinc finger, C3HC4 type (RING finger) and transmembrane domain-containing protein [Spironucleus salmonicida]|eukprot:EST47676.1 Zinc finger, C3HC4 type (RING finger) and transmembrane domain-containing protein [Spironucleus salmonicida]
MQIILILAYGPKPPVYPVIADQKDLSASLSFGTTAKLSQGSQKLLAFKRTAKDGSFPVGVSIIDTTFDTKFYNETQENKTSRATLPRNISASVFYIDGNFSSDQSKALDFKGVYYPETQKGILQGVFFTLFESAKITFNETQAIEFLKNPSSQLLNIFYTNDPKIIEKADNNEIKRKSCDVYLLFEYGKTTRNSITSQYLPDNQIRRQWHILSKKISDTLEEVPQITYQLFSNNCSFEFSGIGPISNSAQSEHAGASFFAVFLVLEFLLAFVAVTYVIKYQSPARIQALSLPSVIFHLNSEYLCSILFIISTSQIPGLRNIAALLAFFGFVVLVPVLLHAVLKIQIFANQFMTNFKKYLFVLLGLTFSMICPGLILLLIAFFVPYLATLILCLIMSSYLLIAILHKFIKADGKVCYPLYFTLVNCVVKVFLLIYCFGVENAFQFEFRKSWLITILCVLLIQNLIYILQYFLGPRFGLFNAKVNQFSYHSQNFNAETLKNIQFSDFFSALIPVPFTGNSKCDNPGHSHSELFNQNVPELHKYEQILPLANTCCFALIHPENIKVACQICLAEVEILKAQNAYEILNICGKKFKQQELKLLSENLIEKETYQAWITPCGHIFHSDCLRSWLDENRVCPIDRMEIPAYAQ